MDPQNPPWWIAFIITPITLGVAWMGRKVADVLAATYIADRVAAREEREQDRADKRKEDEQDRADKREEHARYLLSLESRDATQKASMERLWARQEALESMLTIHHENESKAQEAMLEAIKLAGKSAQITADKVAKVLEVYNG